MKKEIEYLIEKLTKGMGSEEDINKLISYLKSGDYSELKKNLRKNGKRIFIEFIIPLKKK